MKNEIVNKRCALCLDFSKLGKIAEICPNVIPVVVQDWQSREVLILAYANQKAVKETLKRRVAVFWSTSKNRLWVKGEEASGCILKIKEVKVNCEQNSLLYLVERTDGLGACHVKDGRGSYRRSCFYRKLV